MMGRTQRDDEPTLGQAWATLGERLGLAVEERGERSIRAHGSVRGRSVAIEIEGEAARSQFARFLFGLNTISSRKRREKWHSTLEVGVVNPRRATGTIESSVDVNSPAWNPREYDPRNGRSVRANPTSLASQVLDADIHERLMSIVDDVRIEVRPTALRLEHDNTAVPGHGAQYVAGSVLHHYQGSPPPWPDRALIGPPWWIDLLCDMADRLDH